MRKLLLFVITLCFVVCFCVGLSSCGNADISVKLYDGDAFIKVVNVQKDKEYDFGTFEKKGYTFLGWYSEAEGGTAYTDAQGKSAGLLWGENNGDIAYAHWAANKYKIVFDYCDATSNNTVNDVIVTYGDQITSNFPVPQKNGYFFAGWYTDKTNGIQITDASGAFLENTEVYEESVYPLSDDGTKLYARWTSKMVTYMFSTGEGTPVSEVSYPVGTVLYELPVSLKDNYCFVSWSFDTEMVSQMTFPYTIPNDSDEYVTLYANFVAGTTDELMFTTIPSTSDREYEVAYSGNGEKIVIPDSYYGKKITMVSRIEAPNAKEIILPQTVKDIKNGAFENCSLLEKINIPYIVETIPERCFSGCVNLKDVFISRSVKIIGKEAFARCCSITQIALSENITAINAGAFRNMKSLVKFSMYGENERYLVKDDVLYSKMGTSYYLVQYPASKQGETYTIDEATIKISEYAFSSSNISSIVVGEKITAIERGAFENCKKLVNVLLIGSSVSFSIEENAFLNCSNLKALKIESVKVPVLHQTAFEGVSTAFAVYVNSSMIRNYQTASAWRNISDKIYSLGMIFGNFAMEEVEGGYAIRQYFGTDKEVVIPKIINARKIVKICENAFSFSNMEKITISEDIMEIGNNAFKNCALLKTVIMECEPPILGNDVFKNTDKDFGIYIKNSIDVYDAYKSNSEWSSLSEYIWSYQ